MNAYPYISETTIARLMQDDQMMAALCDDRDAWPYDESECVEDMRGRRLSPVITIFCCAVAAWAVVYFAFQGLRAVFL